MTNQCPPIKHRLHCKCDFRQFTFYHHIHFVFAPASYMNQPHMSDQNTLIDPFFRSGAVIFLTQTLYLLPFSQISTFFFDKNLFAAESSIGLYPAWIYSICQVTLELWVMTLCALAQTAIAIPMIGLWNPSVSNIATFVTMFTVFCISGMLGNAIVLVGAFIAMDMSLLCFSLHMLTTKYSLSFSYHTLSFIPHTLYRCLNIASSHPIYYGPKILHS